MSTVRAKFRCDSKTVFSYGGVQYKFAAVYSNKPDHENKAFWDATPNAALEMTINNPTIKDSAFDVGQEYYLDFTPAPKSDP